MEITDLTPAERRLWEAFPSGAGVDFRPDGEPDDAVVSGAWGPERTVRAEVLRALLLSGPRADGEIPALRLSGARVTGRLDLQYATVDCAIRLWVCRFDEVLNLYGAQVRQLNLSESVLPGMRAATLRVDGVLRITGCRIAGPVLLGGARISGAFFLDRARLGAPDTGGDGGDARRRGAGDSDPRPGDSVREPLLQFNQGACEDDIWGRGLVSYGEIRLDGATVAGNVDLDDARLVHPGATVLQAERLTVGSDLRAMRLHAEGRVDLRGARIPGQLNLSYARLTNPGGMALRASSMVCGEMWLRASPPVRGTVNLRRSQLELLHVAPETWPREVSLDGLMYTTLAPHEPAARRLPVFDRDSAGYVPFSYEQLATAYRRIGDEAAVREVQLAKQRRHRTTLPWYAKIWGHVQEMTVGYGFRPIRAAGWLASLLAVGSLVFALHHPPALKPGEAPHFQPVFYTLDLLLPVIDFGQEQAYAPEGWYQSLSYALIVMGWILATTIATGITRVISRQ
ncbi:membrane-associated oxidoreductase [Streptomyces sp. NPDC058001]|uniref:membrane-associated oxidoreductase n=1 Tax=Streptomyces sp. NPDC058001 TaxID=3346300 RepID=UPI0036EF9BB5